MPDSNREERESTEGPFIVWENFGYDGWAPQSYSTLKEALSAQRMAGDFVVTKVVDYDVTEKDLT